MDPARLAEIKAVMQDAQERGFLTRLAERKTDILFYGDHRTAQMILDLIQGIEDAWRERDVWKNEQWLKDIAKAWHDHETVQELIQAVGIARANYEGEFQRADRAEAEVDRIKELWIEDVKDEHDQFIRADAGREDALRTMERLRVELGEVKLILESQDLRLHRYHAVREAAEAVWELYHHGIFYPDQKAALGNLRRTLDAAQEVGNAPRSGV